MTIPRFTSEQIAAIKKQENPLLVRIGLWTAHIDANPKVQFDDFLPTPANALLTGYVLTERGWFENVVKSLNYTYVKYKLHGLWIVTRLGPQTTMPISLINPQRRQPGGFRSSS